MRHRRTGQRGQGIVESSIAMSLLLVVLVGTVDLGRAIYQYNGVAEAAREIARATSVHPGEDSLGDSAEALAVVATQRGLVPALSSPTYACVDIAGTAIAGTCHPGSWVRVTVTSRFDPVLPLLMPFAPFVLTSAGAAEIQ